MSNSENARGVMQILIIKHKLLKETYKRIKGAYQLTEIYSSGKIWYDFYQNWETQILWNSIQI